LAGNKLAIENDKVGSGKKARGCLKVRQPLAFLWKNLILGYEP
jgi:hypothetical protein